MAVILRMEKTSKSRVEISNVIKEIYKSFELFDCIKNGDKIKLNQLYSKMYNMEAKNVDGYTPLIYAASLGREEIVEDLCSWRVNVDACDNKDKTALHYSSTYNHPEVTRALFEWGASIDCKDKQKMTPLHYAVFMGHVPVVRVLLRLGASLTDRNRGNQTPGKIAKDERAGSPEIRDLIREEKRKRKVQQSEKNKTRIAVKSKKLVFKRSNNYDLLPWVDKFQADTNTYEEINDTCNQETSNEDEDALSATQGTQTGPQFPTLSSHHAPTQQNLQRFESLTEEIKKPLLQRANNNTTYSTIRESNSSKTYLSLNYENTSNHINMSPPRRLSRDDSGLGTTLRAELESGYENTEKIRQSSEAMATSPSEPLLNFKSKKDKFPYFGPLNKSQSEPRLSSEIAETISQTTGPMTTSLPKTASERASMLGAQPPDAREIIETPIFYVCLSHTKNQQEQVDNIKAALSGMELKLGSLTSPCTPSNTSTSPEAISKPVGEVDFRPTSLRRFNSAESIYKNCTINFFRPKNVGVSSKMRVHNRDSSYRSSDSD